MEGAVPAAAVQEANGETRDRDPEDVARVLLSRLHHGGRVCRVRSEKIRKRKEEVRTDPVPQEEARNEGAEQARHEGAEDVQGQAVDAAREQDQGGKNEGGESSETVRGAVEEGFVVRVTRSARSERSDRKNWRLN